MQSTIENLIIDYVENNITDELKADFINAAIHFIINEEVCSQYDIMRIRYRFKKIESEDVQNNIKLCVTYGYIIYRALMYNLVPEIIKTKCCEAIIEISNEITKYITMESDEKELQSEIEAEISNLDLSEKCNKLILDKFRNCKLVY